MQNAKCKTQNGGEGFGKAKVIYRQKNFVGTRLAVFAKYSQTKDKGRYIKLYTNIRLTANLRRVYEGDPSERHLSDIKGALFTLPLLGGKVKAQVARTCRNLIMVKNEFKEQITQIKQAKMKPKVLISGHGTTCPYGTVRRRCEYFIHRIHPHRYNRSGATFNSAFRIPLSELTSPVLHFALCILHFILRIFPYTA